MTEWNERGDHLTYVNDTDKIQYVLFITMGGSGFQTDAVLPGKEWREGAGEEYCGCFDSEAEADAYLNQRYYNK